MEKLKSPKGISIIAVILFIVIIICIFVLIGKGKSENTTSLTKEPRSTYIPKCTTIDYKSLARNPNQYKDNHYTFTGKVIQEMNESNSNQTVLRVNVTPKKYEYFNEIDYVDTILVYYQYSSSAESRILEDDIITIYGQSIGTNTYESIMHQSVTIPAIVAMYIDIETK